MFVNKLVNLCAKNVTRYLLILKFQPVIFVWDYTMQIRSDDRDLPNCAKILIQKDQGPLLSNSNHPQCGIVKDVQSCGLIVTTFI